MIYFNNVNDLSQRWQYNLKAYKLYNTKFALIPLFITKDIKIKLHLMLAGSSVL